jgi:SRSO17 transposase
MLSEIRYKSLPEIASSVGLKDGQSLHHFLRDALWDVKKMREIRLWLTKMFVGEREIIGVAEGRYESLRDWNIPEFKVVQ